MTKDIVVGIAQMTSNDNSIQNIEAIEDLLETQSEGCDLVVFPENCLFFRTDKTQKMMSFEIDGPELNRLNACTKKMGKTVWLGGVQIRTAAGVTNSIVLLTGNNSPQVIYSKIHLFDVDVPGAPSVRESEVYVAGQQANIIEFKGFLIGLSICYDLRFSNLYSIYADAGVDLIVVPSSFLVPTGEAHWHSLLRARAIESQCYVVAPAQSGEHLGQGGIRKTYGHSMAIGPWGEVVLDLENQRPTIGTIKIAKSEIEKVRNQIPMKNHRKKIAGPIL